MKIRKTTDDKKNPVITSNVKILVDWENKKIIHTPAHLGSKEYKLLINRGYEDVGTIKSVLKDGTIMGNTRDEGIDEAGLKIFWRDEFFRPQDKYV